jgi:hypothetical protein
MRLRVAKKLVRQVGSTGRRLPRDRLRKAAYRYLRWPGRPRIEGSIEVGFHHLDEQHRLQPPTGDFIRDTILWEVSKNQFFDKTPNGWVNTLFLGIDHGYGGKAMWFETALSRPSQPIEVLRRHHTRDEAEAFHYAQVEALRRGGAVITES